MAQPDSLNRILTPPLKQGNPATSPVSSRSQVLLRPTSGGTIRTGSMNSLLKTLPHRVESSSSPPTVATQDSMRSPSPLLLQKQIQIVQPVQPIAKIPPSPSAQRPLLPMPPNRSAKPQSEAKVSRTQSSIQSNRAPISQTTLRTLSPPLQSAFPAARERIIERQILREVRDSMPLRSNQLPQVAKSQESRSQQTQPATRSQVPLRTDPSLVKESKPNLGRNEAQSIKAAPKILAIPKLASEQIAVQRSRKVRVQPDLTSEVAQSETRPATKKASRPQLNVLSPQPTPTQPDAIIRPKQEPVQKLKPQPLALQPRPQSSLRSLTAPTPKLSPPQENTSVKIEIGRVEIIAKSASKASRPKQQVVRPRSHSIEAGLSFLDGGR